jgi:hypothetical protein
MSIASSSLGEMINACKISAGKPEGKTPLERTTHRSDILTLILNKQCLKWTEQAVYVPVAC